ncbi:MAG TPA: PatB family C-S lyase, partial [Bacteroidales bacterium]|nr:PatB family C-S lyase [Bacteroidales bacterium]
DVLPLWVADMDFRTPPFIMDALRRRAEHEVMGYTVRSEAYHLALMDWVGRRHGWAVEKDWILFSPGVVPALSMLVMAFTRPGEKVIVQPPVYSPFFSVVKENGREVVDNPLCWDGECYRMDLDQLRRVIDPQTRMIFICNPHNPVGRAWGAEELRALAEVCLERGVLMVSDEIHCDLVLPGHRHVPLASLSEEIAARTITCMAPSKTFNLAGLATSHVIISDKGLRETFHQTLERVHVWLGNIFGAVAAEAAYTGGEDWLREMLDYVQGNIDFLADFLQNNIPQIRMIRPEATYMAWLDCRALGLDDAGLKDFFIKKARLGLNDGPSFGLGGSGFQRINLACPRSIVEEAAKRLKEGVNNI